jgi:hypothetical protein
VGGWGKAVGLAAGIVAALAGVAAVVIMIGNGGSDADGSISAEQSGEGNVLQAGEGNNSCVNESEGSVQTCIFGPHISTAEVASVEELQQQRFDESPQDVIKNGPWPFIVYDTEEPTLMGLKVRSSNTADGVQLGAIVDRGTAWVDCREDSGFDPDPVRGVGGLWYRVRWPSEEPSNSYLESEPSSPYAAWAFAGYLAPVGHNGQVPEC